MEALTWMRPPLKEKIRSVVRKTMSLLVKNRRLVLRRMSHCLHLESAEGEPYLLAHHIYKHIRSAVISSLSLLGYHLVAVLNVNRALLLRGANLASVKVINQGAFRLINYG